MLTPPREDRRSSAIHAIWQWWRNWMKGDLANFADMPPHFAISAVGRQRIASGGGGGFDLLLIRMEALQLDPGEVKRIESPLFLDLAEACIDCERKDRCEQDLAYMSAGTVTQDWEKCCPNATVLNAMRELPWFGNDQRSAC